MNASKENARLAKKQFLEIIESSPSLHTVFGKNIQFVSEFLLAATRRLPSEDSIARDKVRRKIVK